MFSSCFYFSSEDAISIHTCGRFNHGLEETRCLFFNQNIYTNHTFIFIAVSFCFSLKPPQFDYIMNKHGLIFVFCESEAVLNNNLAMFGHDLNGTEEAKAYRNSDKNTGVICVYILLMNEHLVSSNQ